MFGVMRVGQVDEKSSSSTLRDPAAQNRGFVCALLAGLDNAAGDAVAGPRRPRRSCQVWRAR